MASAELKKIQEVLAEVSTKQAQYEKLYLGLESKEQNTAGVTCVSGADLSAQGNHLQEISDMIATVSAAVESLQASVSKLDARVSNNERWLDSLEQYGRSNCLILHGSKRLEPAPSSYQAFEEGVISTLNTSLNLPVDVTSADIDICHSLPSAKNKNPIIIKFVKRTVRNVIFAHKKNLKQTNKDLGRKLSITESLTKRRLRLLEEARKVFLFNNVWTNNGNIYCKFAGHKHLVDDFNDINKIRFQM